ncbi:hypothetical protein Bca4012_025934 [Brassica carinata]|uniref:Uncharacterized protein n=1 Tax=Brassica carinata TaxID=52824 RepID=A0A8X8AV57_BRACI|nr:hypothetical protein Bca52824_023014 [Brassica carinata]
MASTYKKYSVHRSASFSGCVDLLAICFAIGRIILGETEVVKNIDFDKVWKCGRCARIYKPVGIPEGFHCSGHGCIILQLVTEPTVYFRPEETYVPSSVPWFF